MSKIVPFFPKSHRVARVDDRRIISDVICVLKDGLQRLVKPNTNNALQSRMCSQTSRAGGALPRVMTAALTS